MVGFSFAGFAAAAVSTYVHVQLLSDPAYTSFCDINTNVSCTQVYQSRYGSVFGVPVALGGVIWFAGVLLLAFADARVPRETASNIAGYLMVWSTLGLAVAMYMVYASLFVLQTYCVLCVVVYVAVIGIFILSGSGVATPVRRLPIAMFGDLCALIYRPVGLGLLVVFVGGSLASVTWFARGMRPVFSETTETATNEVRSPAAVDQRTEFVRYWESQQRLELTLPDSIRETINSDVAVVVIKFNDYQCPACANAHRAYAPIFAKYASSHPGRVRQVILDYPLDPECNEQAPRGLHYGACAAAVAVRIAADLGDAVRSEMEEWLYANQQGLTRDTVVQAFGDLTGINAETYNGAYDEMIRGVQEDIELGDELPVEATPTYVINGIVVKGSLAPEYFDAAIRYELERIELELTG